jgi:hypothetical protein
MDRSAGSWGGLAAATEVSSESVGGVGEERRSLPPTLIILVPAYNEAVTIAAVVEGARAHAPVIVIDDGSTDDTAARAEAAGAEVIRHGRRLGKGQALRTGMAAAAIRRATAVITLDGDGQHDPADIPRLRAAAGAADGAPDALVVGGRLGESGGFRRGRLNAVRVAGFFVNWATGLHVEDTQSGFRLYPLALVRDLPTRRGGFVFETEVLVAAARRGIAVREVAVGTAPRTAQRSRFRPIVDGVSIGAYLAGRAMRQWAVEFRRPHRRRAATAAAGMALSPVVLLVLAVCQSALGALGGRFIDQRVPDLVSPLVRRWFSQERLGAPAPADGRGVALVASARPSPSAPSLPAPPGVPS